MNHTLHKTPEMARNAVYSVFAFSGVCFATLVSRLPDFRSALELSNGGVGLLLLASSLGSLVFLPLAGRLIERFGAAGVVRAGAVAVAIGLAWAAIVAGSIGDPWVAGLGLFAMGAGISIWDVAMNVEGAEVERRLGYTIMPRFHAAWSIGSIGGSVLGIPMAGFDVPMGLHASVVGVLVLVAAWWFTRDFLPLGAHGTPEGSDPTSVKPWRERRTLLIGLMVLCFAFVEGSANDWLTLALIDGYDLEHWVAVGGFTIFVISMALGRIFGPIALDRYGRAPMLWGSAVFSFIGIMLTVFGTYLPVVLVGVVIWGLASALGFPVGMSAAADDPIGAAKRVSAVSTIGYGAFLVGPPALGWLGDHIGTLDSLLVVACLMIPAFLSVFAVREEPGRRVGAAGV